MCICYAHWDQQKCFEQLILGGRLGEASSPWIFVCFASVSTPCVHENRHLKPCTLASKNWKGHLTTGASTINYQLLHAPRLVMCNTMAYILLALCDLDLNPHSGDFYAVVDHVGSEVLRCSPSRRTTRPLDLKDQRVPRDVLGWRVGYLKFQAEVQFYAILLWFFCETLFLVKFSSWFRLVWRSEHCRGGSKAPGARCSLRSVNEDQRDRCQAINLDIQHTVQICTGSLASLARDL